MYKVKFDPDKCTNKFFVGCNEAGVLEIAEYRYRHHKSHGCMTVLEHYQYVSVLNPPCPTCGHITNKMVKKVIT